MTPERWQQIKELLYQAQELAPEERSAFLERCCSSDHALRQEVETLLSSSDAARTSFLENSPGQVTLTPGTKLGDYEVQKLLGSGGMGEVYRARDLRLRRDVAIKVLPSFLSSDKERLRRFEHEAQASAALNHPNILAVFQLGTYHEAPYLVSELLEGETLRAQINRGPLLARKAIDYGVQIAHGLAAAHEKGIVHRDLKPENLFAAKDGRVKILDFGLAKLTQPESSRQHGAPTVDGDATEPGTVMGTAGYMSPEQVRGRNVDHRTDIFAFGAILYEMLTGKRAFQKTTSAETMSAILNEEPPPVSQVAANVSPALQRTVHRCLEKSPEQRFQSASDLAFALEALSDSAVTPPPRVRPARPAIAKWRSLGLAVPATVLFIAGIVWWQAAPELPRVKAVRQLTDDGEAKLTGGAPVLVTDGLRVYFAKGPVDYCQIVQVSVTGGQTAFVPMRFKYANVDDLSPDASSLLISSGDGSKKWIQPLPTGEARGLNLDYQDARFFPDGRIVFAAGDSVYVANLDGSSHRKLASAPGQIFRLAVSPDGKRIRFTVIGNNLLYSIWEVNSDGTGLHQVPIGGLPETIGEIAGGWSHDGKYFLFQTERGGRWDLWALPERSGLFHNSAAPLQLTNGPLSYESPVGSPEGKQVFAVGSKRRGELIRYDTKSRQFVPYLSGISAVESRVSRDGKWVIYVSYPDHALWRSRSDGSDRMQLTFPPMMVFYPEISPDGTKVAFSGMTASSGMGVYVLNMEGGQPEKVEIGHAPAWSPDGNSLAFFAIIPGHHPFDESHWSEIRILDLHTKKVSVIATPEIYFGPWWPQPDKLVAAETFSTSTSSKPHLFDFKTQKWSDLGGGFDVENWVPSPDGKYLYGLTNGVKGPQVLRLRASDFKVETVADFGGGRLISDDSLSQASSGAWMGIAADGSPTLTRDVGSDEIYALDVKWP